MSSVEENFYTPEYVIQALLNHHKLNAPILEPAVGKRAIADMIENDLNIYVETNDIDPDARANTHLNFLETDFKVSFLENYKTIITNPPFSKAQEFVEHALEIINRGGDVIMLLRINFLGSAKRIPFWRINQPYKIIIVTPRPSFTKKGVDNCEYAWFIWRDGYHENKTILVFSEKEGGGG